MFKKISSFIFTLWLSACAEHFNEQHINALAKVEQGATLIDVRSSAEFATGHLDGAINIPHTNIVAGVKNLGLTEKSPIVLYCRSGNRSGQAMTMLNNAGFINTTNAGGYQSLLAAQGH